MLVVLLMGRLVVLVAVVEHLVVEVLGTRQLNLRHKEIMVAQVEIAAALTGVQVAVAVLLPLAAIELA
jgi:hypothetical protein